MDKLAYEFNASMAEWAITATAWMDPWWWVSTALLLFVFMVIGVWPLMTHPNHTQLEAIGVLTRKMGMLVFAVLVVAFPLVLLTAVTGTSANEKAAAANFITWFVGMAKDYWSLFAAAFLAGWSTKLMVSRYGHTYVSSLMRKFRVVQSGDVQSDIRREIAKYEPVDFLPSKHYKKGKMFLGLDESNKPIYVPLDLYYETHMQIMGPTRTGKGVLLGVILDQAIRQGDSVFFIDPKTDKFIPHIMAQAAEAVGRPFIYLDLNGGGQGKWAPFMGGDLRDRRARMISTYGLQSRGTDADVYLARERGVVDRLLKNTNGSLVAMANYIREHELEELSSRLGDGLKEWAEVPTFTPRKNRGFSVRRSLLENAVVYVRGSIKDHVVRDATRSFIIELVQEISSLSEQRKGHLTLAVDEVRFVISEPLVDALATVAGFGVNIITAYQSILDIRNLPDKTIDRQATEQSVNVNSQIKVLYRAPDPDTAEWGAKLSGTQLKTVPRIETTNIGKYGEETWGDSRMMTSVEEYLITENLLLGLKPRVAVVYQPGKLASVCRTSWVSVEKQYEPREPATAEEQPKEQKQNKEPEKTQSTAEKAEDKHISIDEL